MKKTIIYLLLCLPVYAMGQAENSPEIIWQEAGRLYREGKLDSIETAVYYFNQPDDELCTIVNKFYTRLDTFDLKNGYYGVGYTTIDPYMEFNREQVGEWTCYYPSGKVYAKGKFSIGSYTECQAGGPRTSAYAFRTGNWTYWYENGDKMAEGTYEPLTRSFKNNCGITYWLGSVVVAEKWKFPSAIVQPEIAIKEIVDSLNAINRFNSRL